MGAEAAAPLVVKPQLRGVGLPGSCFCDYLKVTLTSFEHVEVPT